MTFDQWAAQRDFDPLERATAKLAWDAGYKASEDEFHAPLNTPASRSRAALPANIRRTLEASNLPIEVATAIADQCEMPDALALLRELNDALVIPERFQARVDAVLDRAEEQSVNNAVERDAFAFLQDIMARNLFTEWDEKTSDRAFDILERADKQSPQGEK